MLVTCCKLVASCFIIVPNGDCAHLGRVFAHWVRLCTLGACESSNEHVLAPREEVLGKSMLGMLLYQHGLWCCSAWTMMLHQHALWCCISTGLFACLETCFNVLFVLPSVITLCFCIFNLYSSRLFWHKHNICLPLTNDWVDFFSFSCSEWGYIAPQQALCTLNWGYARSGSLYILIILRCMLKALHALHWDNASSGSLPVFWCHYCSLILVCSVFFVGIFVQGCGK